MKLEPNMYVRTKNGNIRKIVELTNTKFIDEPDYYVDKVLIDIEQNEIEDTIYMEKWLFNEDIVKSSLNIIDLIEEKDLLEIEYFSLRYEKRVTRLFEVTYKEGRFINLDNAKCQFMLIDNDWTDNDKELEPIIKSIVTKEMYSSVEYRLRDDE